VVAAFNGKDRSNTMKNNGKLARESTATQKENLAFEKKIAAVRVDESKPRRFLRSR